MKSELKDQHDASSFPTPRAATQIHILLPLTICNITRAPWKLSFFLRTEAECGSCRKREKPGG